MEYVTLNNGIKFPVIGLGTFPMKGNEVIEAVKSAANLGYNAFDTAAAYGNSEALGMALKESFSRREDFFVTTKLSNKHQRTLEVRNALIHSLNYLGLEYVDLYLMHWPNPETYLECYSQMQSVYEEGLTRAIGVCNFQCHHLEHLMAHAEITPAINQIELHPLLAQVEIVSLCQKLGISIMAYSPLARMHENLMQQPLLIQLAKKYNREVTQIILKWEIQQGYLVIPKSSNTKRQWHNINLFDFTLSKEDMRGINGLNQNFRIRHDPDHCNFMCL